jgi:hypothetical protein
MSTLPALIDREPLAVAEDKDAKVRYSPLSRSLEANTSMLIAFFSPLDNPDKTVVYLLII